MAPLFELPVTRARPGSRDVAGHLYRQLKEAIIDGRLPAGLQLPSNRRAPDVFGTSRNTAQDVYDRLAQDGLVRCRHGSGTYVRAQPAQPASGQGLPDTVNNPLPHPVWSRSDIRSWIGFWNEEQGLSAPITADLRPALVDQKLFPHATFRQIMARQLRQREIAPASSRSPQGNAGNRQLRTAIAHHIGLTRAVVASYDDILVTSGAQQGFDIIARTLVEPGSVVAIEDPGYPPMRVPFAAAGARLVPVRVDAEGLVVEDIPDDAKIICACPSHQFPLGMTTSRARREALLDFAARRGAVIVEDDYDGEFRHDGSPIMALRSAGSADNVCYVGTFSKTMLPSLRLGYLVPPPWALARMITAKNAMDWHCSVPLQATVAAFIASGNLARHIKRMRRVYDERRKHMLGLVDAMLSSRLTVMPSSYGMHLALRATRAFDAAQVSRALARRGIMIHSLDRYFLDEVSTPGFVLGFGACDHDTLSAAISALSDALNR